MRRAALLLLVLAACPRHTVPTGPLPQPQELYEQAQKAHLVPSSLVARVRASVSAPENSGRSPLYIAVEKPASARLEVLNPVGDPQVILVASGGRFAMLNLRENIYQHGPATPENLSRLLRAPLRPEELVALVLGAIPELPDGKATSVQRNGDGYLLVLSSDDLTEEIALGPDLRMWEVRRKRGDALLWLAKLDRYSDESGAPVPMSVHVEVPNARTEVDLNLRSVVTNDPPPASAFQLGPPQGARVEEVK
jgi:hypothetical protein